MESSPTIIRAQQAWPHLRRFGTNEHATRNEATRYAVRPIRGLMYAALFEAAAGAFVYLIVHLVRSR